MDYVDQSWSMLTRPGIKQFDFLKQLLVVFQKSMKKAVHTYFDTRNCQPQGFNLIISETVAIS